MRSSRKGSQIGRTNSRRLRGGDFASLISATDAAQTPPSTKSFAQERIGALVKLNTSHAGAPSTHFALDAVGKVVAAGECATRDAH